MKILVACEFSGTLREAFRKRGHNAWSCDLLPSEIPGQHYQRDIRDVLYMEWDMIIAFPPCTHLSASGAKWFEQKRKDGRQQEGIDFFMLFANHPCPRIAIENPVGIMSSIYRKPDQIIQPYQFGHPESKATCLWLKGLSRLRPTNVLAKPEGGHWDNRLYKLSPSFERWKIRSRTFDGIAEAMAEQWGGWKENRRGRRKESKKKKILNLYAGVGGNRKFWNADVTAVEIDKNIASVYSGLYPCDKIVITDAHQYLLENANYFDFIWSSPPCQSHSHMARYGRNRRPRYADLQLYEEILFLKYNYKGLWVVENVVPYYKPLITPEKKIGRHLIWSNFPITDTETPEFENMINRQNSSDKVKLQEWLGIFYEKNIYYGNNHCTTQVLRNCVHPNIGLHILNCANNFSQ